MEAASFKRVRQAIRRALARFGPPGANTRKFTVSHNYFFIKGLQGIWITIEGAYGAAKYGGKTIRV
jgi:hypothetical protein